MFCKCCEKRTIETYSIIHEPTSLGLKLSSTHLPLLQPCSWNGEEQLIGFALEKAGYTIMKQAPIIVSQKCRLFCDIIAKKDGKTFAIEIKSYSGQRYIGIQELELFTSSNPDLPKDTYRVLFIDTSRVRKEVRKQELNIDNLTIIDLKQIKQLFNGESLELLSCSIAV